MLFYSGDKDGSVPTIGSVGWINAMNRTVVEPWRAWWLPAESNPNAQVGGYVLKLDGMDFVTVHGAGHMVPLDKPDLAYHMFDNWVNDLPL